MSPRQTRRSLLRSAAAAGVVGLAGCNQSSLPGSATVQNEGDSDYDVLLRHRFDYDPSDGEAPDVELHLEARKLPDADAVGGTVAFEETVTLAPERTTRRFTDAFAGDDVHEWILTAELTALVGEEPLLDGDDIVDAADTSDSGRYRFQPGSDRDPENNVLVVTTSDDDSEDNAMTLEQVRVDTVASLRERPPTTSP